MPKRQKLEGLRKEYLGNWIYIKCNDCNETLGTFPADSSTAWLHNWMCKLDKAHHCEVRHLKLCASDKPAEEKMDLYRKRDERRSS